MFPPGGVLGASGLAGRSAQGMAGCVPFCQGTLASCYAGRKNVPVVLHMVYADNMRGCMSMASWDRYNTNLASWFTSKHNN